MYGGGLKELHVPMEDAERKHILGGLFIFIIIFFNFILCVVKVFVEMPKCISKSKINKKYVH
uniref:Uncharacterized protein n=1 Tax=Arundo donax TaxID=35708 RepID=A0A0A9GP54_ARUDO